MEKEIKILENQIYDGKVLKFYVDKVKCPNGNESTREHVKHPGGVCILGFIDNKAIMEKQYRYPYDDIILELPAGKLEKNEDPTKAALREFEEETGYKANNIESFGCMYPSCGYSNEIIHLFVATNLTKTKTNFDEDENIDIELIDLDTLKTMILDGIIKDAKTIILITKYILSKR